MRTLTPTDTQVDLTVNKLNEEAFNDLSAQDRLDDNQLYVVTENQYMVLGQGSGATIRDIYTEEIDTKLKSLILNRLNKDKFDELSSHSPDEIWFIQDSELSGQPIVVDTRPGPNKLSEFENDVPYLSAVSWNDINNRPTIPTQTSQLMNDSGYVTSAWVMDYVNDQISAALEAQV